MRLHRLAFIIPIFVTVACGSSSTPTDARDTKPGTDATGKAGADGGAGGAGGSAGTGTDAATETGTDTPIDGTGTDTPIDGVATDGGTDGLDAALDLASVEVKSQKLVSTVLVINQIPDGGADAAAAAAADAGPDAHLMPTVDPNLINAWGLAFNPTGPIWVSAAGKGVSTIYSSAGAIQPLVVTIPPPTGGAAPSAPTGQVFNPTATAFMADKFIFATEGGTIAGWQTGTAAVTRAENATSMASYKGLTLATRNNVPRLFATDFHNGKVDAYDSTYAKITTTGGFADATIPTGFAPFGILADGPVVYVSYAKQDATAHDDVAGAGNGYVNVFDFDGVFTKRLVSTGLLNSPWGLAISPSDFGALSHALIVGNFGNGRINAYDLVSGAFVGAATTTAGGPLVIDGLWALVFGNDTAGAAHNQLFFTAGPDDEMHGVLGRLDFVP